MNLPTYSELKTRARLGLLGRYATAIFATLCAEVIAWAAAALFSFSGRTALSLLLSVLTTFLLSVLAIMLDGGFHAFYLNMTRDRQVKVTDIFYCFRVHPDNAVRLSLLLAAANLAASVPYLLLDLAFPASGSILTELGLILVWLIPMAAVNLLYSMALYLFVDDPNQRPLSIMQKSRHMTRGFRLRLAGLFLSFAGYGLLCILSLGLGFLWVGPYLQMTLTQFYLELRALDRA